MVKCTLFDVDGVLTLSEEIFSVYYAKSQGLDIKPFEYFFKNQWHSIVTGKKDLIKSIESKPELWRWNGSTEDLLKYWFKAEDKQNKELLKTISIIKEKGTPCYVATDQEKYRTNYIKNVMFKDLFNGYFSSCEIGFTKNDLRFYEFIINELKIKDPNLLPEEIMFFDVSQYKVDTARKVGINARLYKSNEQIISLFNL